VIDENGHVARLPIRISLDDPEPMYRQIEAQLRDLIVSGKLPTGTALPSVRGLARELSCSVITTRRAYQDLEGEGLVRTRQGMGTVVADLGDKEKERYRRESVLAAFAEAVEAGRRAGYGPEELEGIFTEAMHGPEGRNG
jgi:GntR family transcriptional regulator